MRYSSLFLALALLLCPTLALAETSCPQHFPDGKAPELAGTRALCFSSFAVSHSAKTRGPLLAAEHLVGSRLKRGHPDRVNSFHAETRLDPSERSELKDYAASGYDRGHLAPSADMTTKVAQHESFSLSNMVPQIHESNAVLWAHIEARVRELAIERGSLFVITGPMFEGDTVRALHRRVLVPTRMFKLVIDPSTGEAAAYVAPNSAGSCWQSLSLDELRERLGFDPVPGREAGRLTLPEPGVAPAGDCPLERPD